MTSAPWGHTITLTSADTNYNLYTLLAAIDPTIPKRCQMIQIQANEDFDTDFLWIGDPDTLSSTDRGVELVSTQAQIFQSMDANLIFLPDIALRSNGAGHTVNVILVTR